MIYHSGELAAQARAGVGEQAEQLSKSISSILKPSARDFLQNQRLAIASTVDLCSRVWASLLTGEPGFLQALAERTVRIDAAPVPGDPFIENLRSPAQIGLIAIDLATRRRLRLNGKASLQPDGSIHVYTQQVYFNCPKYIQSRYLDTDVTEPCTVDSIQQSAALTEKQQHKIAQTDTFFIASFHPESGADASHRGGYPGFVRVLNASQLVFPDYAGNNMFNTLGNISLNPLAGLLFVDFATGSTLQLTGSAHVVWDTKRLAEFVGAERLVEFQIYQVIEISNATSLRWHLLEYSPFNPVYIASVPCL